jgi:hypothetical protein
VDVRLGATTQNASSRVIPFFLWNTYSDALVEALKLSIQRSNSSSGYRAHRPTMMHFGPWPAAAHRLNVSTVNPARAETSERLNRRLGLAGGP